MIPADTWRAVVRVPGLAAYLLDEAERGGADAVLAALDRYLPLASCCIRSASPPTRGPERGRQPGVVVQLVQQRAHRLQRRPWPRSQPLGLQEPVPVGVEVEGKPGRLRRLGTLRWRDEVAMSSGRPMSHRSGPEGRAVSRGRGGGGTHTALQPVTVLARFIGLTMRSGILGIPGPAESFPEKLTEPDPVNAAVHNAWIPGSGMQPGGVELAERLPVHLLCRHGCLHHGRRCRCAGFGPLQHRVKPVGCVFLMTSAP